MQAYLHTDREYFRGMDEQAAKDDFIERRQEELIDSLKHGDVKQVTRVCDSIDWDKGNSVIEVMAVLLAKQNPDSDTTVESLFRGLIDAAINSVIEDEVWAAKDMAFEMERD